MGKGDPKKLRGKMSSYHKKKHPDASVTFSEFSKKCSEMWKIMSAKDKGTFEDMAKADKAHYEREMKIYIPPKGETKEEIQGPQCTLGAHFSSTYTNAPKGPPSAFFLFCSEYYLKVKGEHPSLCIDDVAKTLVEMWNKTAADNKQPHEKKAENLMWQKKKKKRKKEKKRVIKAEKSKQKKQEEEDEEEDEDEEKKDDDE
ncbi:unnamed protein product [Nyctereutes procyonoides]|uniref:(raccoon dog) hypothetical protein n=1 Tax=Nyctereutes procyonoides TaxID=34880 RepID=A0A811YWD6_NYCPR|nr:unnamed protein product [Nyctereutes procyonoides]